VLARAARLSPPARRLLEAVAIVPGHVEPWLLEALAGDLLDHLDECLASGMLDARIAFRHELARLAIEASVPPHRTLAPHRAALAALAARGDDYAPLAHDAEAAGDAEAVVRWAPRAAARAAAAGAHREAAARYARALRYPAALAPDARAELLRRRADECYLTAQFEEAIEQLGRLGARPAAAIVARRLRRRGVRGVPRGPRERTRSNPAGLTAHELEVLRLLTDGLRNAQIAERLVVSERTVDHHVSAVLRKLVASTRGEAAARAPQLGLAGPPA
jgi:DNA-binding NarL/FixJ family response regulator